MTRLRRTLAVAGVMLAIAAGTTRAAGPGEVASAAEVQAAVAAMAATMKPGQGFAWRPLVRDGERVVALEYWKTPGRPAVHPDQAEYAIVVAGAGVLVSGGTLEAPVAVDAGLTEGDRIVGGTSRPIGKGDVMLIPAGVPHWFGVTGARLVLLGTKMPVRHPPAG